MKKFAAIFYLLAFAALILPLSGCGGGSSGGGGESQTQTAQDRLMVITSSLLKQNSSYKLYRGRNVSARFNDNSSPTYYVAPGTSGQNVTINLEFANDLGDDQPFMITTDEDSVVFFYNPSGSGQTDTTTPSNEVTRWGGSTNQLSYSGLTVSTSAIDVDTSEELVITLSGSTATVNGSAVPNHNYVWHADPDHRDEYYTLGLDGTQEYSESDLSNYIQNVEGVYINRDIRYMPNTLSFTGQVKDDNETEYAAYYSDSVAAEVAAELGTGFEGPYIFATLPGSMGMGGGPGGGGNPPQRNARSAVSNSDIAAFSTMTHSAEDAYNNPVLHITGSGVYRLKGTWNGQIWIEVGSEEDDQVALILDGVTVTCSVAPALVFKEVYECGPEDNVVSFDVAGNLHSRNGTNAGAIVVIADGTTNNFTGANVYRMLKAEKKKDSVTTIDGSDVSQQKKRCKMDGAFYSFQSMVIGAENENGNGVLNITSTTYEGLDTEMHLLIDDGIVTVTAEDDGINVNEDDTSVFTMNGGSLTITTPNGDGIDSNGYIVINGGTLDITAAQDSNSLDAQAEGPLDSNLGVYMSDSVNYTHRAYSGGNSNTAPQDNQNGTNTNDNVTTTTREPFTVTNSQGNAVMTVSYSNPVSDTDTSDRGIDESSSVFTLTHRVNSFSGVK
ncbi:MAG: carbohydrate-binding domain-containing protein [Synergistaceae bacterium]|nr:carbohydrate-binding domain-containing protein [Synergistaceae bacterium]